MATTSKPSARCLSDRRARALFQDGSRLASLRRTAGWRPYCARGKTANPVRPGRQRKLGPRTPFPARRCPPRPRDQRISLRQPVAPGNCGTSRQDVTQQQRVRFEFSISLKQVRSTGLSARRVREVRPLVGGQADERVIGRPLHGFLHRRGLGAQLAELGVDCGAIGLGCSR